jgi:hypothetical protein
LKSIMQRRVGRAFGEAIGALRRAKEDYKRATTPQPDLPGVRRPFLIDPELWERLETDDIKYALKVTWKEYVRSLDPFFNRAEFKRRQEEAARATEEAERRAEEEASGAASQAEPGSPASGGQPTVGARVGAAAREAAGKLSSEELRQSAVKVAAHLASAIKDPKARAKVAELATKGVITAHGVVDSFLIGYYEGQALEMEKEKKEQEEAEAERLRQEEAVRTGKAAPSTFSSNANKTAFDVLTEVLQERHQKNRATSVADPSTSLSSLQSETKQDVQQPTAGTGVPQQASPPPKADGGNDGQAKS